MSEKIKTTMRRILEEVWSKGNLDALDEIYAADVVWHHPNFPDVKDIEAYKQLVVESRSLYPDLRIVIHEVISEGDTVAVRFAFEGTHTSGKFVITQGNVFSHLVDGKVVEEWGLSNQLGLLEQLGLLPPMEEDET